IQEQKPICFDQGPVNQYAPEAYWDYAKWVSVVSARYGARNVCNNPFDPTCGLLRSAVMDGDVVGAGVSGLGFLKYMELGNEPDKWWYDDVNRNTPNALYQMMPQQYAALLDAAYDGAGKSPSFLIPGDPGSYLGIKNIDPQIKVAMAGLSEFRGRYMIEMLESAYSLRASNPAIAKKIPFDILNIHHYCSSNPFIGADYINQPALWNNYDYFGFNDKGVSPEQCQLRKRYERYLERLITEIPTDAIRKELLKMQYWLSEFGYDTNKGSWVKAVLEQNNQSYFTTQAQWLVRSYLELAAVEYEYEGQKMVLDKVAAFDLRDVGPHGEDVDASPNGGLFTHSGLLTNDFKPKRSWYHIQTMIHVLGDTKFTKDLNPTGAIQFDNGGAAPRIFYFKNPDGKRVLAIWSPTATKVTDRHLTIPLSVLAQNASDYGISATDRYTIIQPTDNNEAGARLGFDVSGGNLKLDASTVSISETPIYVVLGQKISDPAVRYPAATPRLSPYCNEALLEWNPASSNGCTWNIYYARKNLLPVYTNCMDYKSVDLLGNGVVQTYRTGVPLETGRLLLNGLAASTPYVLFLVYVNAAGIPANEPLVFCFSTTDIRPCVFNPCFTITAPEGCLGAYATDYNKLAIENEGTTYNFDCPPTQQGPYTGGDPKNIINCAAYSTGTGCGNPFLFPDSQLWSVCNKPEVVVEFKTPVLLNAIKFYHHSGSDLVEIYYGSCKKPNERIYVTTFRPNSCNTWVSLNENMPLAPVSKLYFRKITARGRNINPNVKIGKLHFCGSFSTDCGSIENRQNMIPDLNETQDAFCLSPNPATGEVKARWGRPNYSTIRLFNLAGSLVLSMPLSDDQKQARLDVHGLPQGVYVVELEGEGMAPLRTRLMCAH
ncbi:MAG: T9SS type A sorting domain-containing protein, partial [Bacteroidota bacterium]